MNSKWIYAESAFLYLADVCGIASEPISVSWMSSARTDKRSRKKLTSAIIPDARIFAWEHKQEE